MVINWKIRNGCGGTVENADAVWLRSICGVSYRYRVVRTHGSGTGIRYEDRSTSAKKLVKQKLDPLGDERANGGTRGLLKDIAA